MTGILPDDVPASSLVYGYFDSFAASTGAPTSITGLAVGDIKIYKDGGTTERASTSGFTLLNTTGIDFDSIVGINGFSIDLSDNTTAGFYAANHHYAVVVSTITVDGQTVSFIAGTFWIEQTGGALALIKSVISGAGVNVTQFGGTNLTAAAGIPEVKVASVANNAITAASIATDAIDNDAIAANAVTEIQSGLATSAALTTVGSNVLGVKGVTDALPDSGALTSIAQASALTTVGNNVGTIINLIGTPSTSVSDDIAAVNTRAVNIQGRIPAALVSGRIDASVGAMAANVVTASAIATDAIGAAEIAAAGANKIADHIIRRTQANARASSDGDAVNSRSLLGMLSLHRNKKDVSGGNLIVKAEDDTTTFFTDVLSTDAAAVPIIGVDPA